MMGNKTSRQKRNGHGKRHLTDSNLQHVNVSDTGRMPSDSRVKLAASERCSAIRHGIQPVDRRRRETTLGQAPTARHEVGSGARRTFPKLDLPHSISCLRPALTPGAPTEAAPRYRELREATRVTRARQRNETMAVETDQNASAHIGEAVVAFALEGRFPDEQVSSLSLSSSDLSPAIDALERAKGDLESEIHTINEETKGDVSSWVHNAKTLQEDILRSKRLADDIVRQSEAPQVSGKAIQDAKDHIQFLEKEVLYTNQLHDALRGIQHVNELLGEVEQAMNERRIIDSLRWLEKSWTELDAVPVNKKACRIMRLLDVRAFELKSHVHDVFDHVWASLVHTNLEAGSLAIYNKLDDEQMTLSEAIIGLQAYKEVEDRMSKLWHDVDKAIVFPRMDTQASSLPSIRETENVVELNGQAGRSIDELFTDLQKVVEFLAKRLTPDLLMFFSPIMMSDLVPRLISVWLDSEVPSNLKDLGRFQAVIESARRFCEVLEDNGFTGFTELKEWVGSAPSIWLAKCRETALDSVRVQMSNGLGATKQVEKVEKQMVSRSEGKELTANGVAGTVAEDDWGAEWGVDDDEEPEAKGDTQEEDDGADAWGWNDEEQTTETAQEETVQVEEKTADDEDDAADAWGWGDDDATEPTEPEPKPQAAKTPTKKHKTVSAEPDESREMVLKETYHISSMPEPVLELILALLEDGAALTQPEYVASSCQHGDPSNIDRYENSPVAAAAPGLFSLPTFALAMFRAVSPHYYSLDIGGNMFLYNDAMYLSEKLADLASTWKSRGDLTTRAQNMLRIDNDIKSLQNFATRAYTNELGLQKTVLRDLLGGDQSLMQQDELDSCVDSALARVRSMAVTWESILARSVWYQAVGSLLDGLSSKIIGDVMDASSIGQDDAYGIAKLIVKVTELDDLFLPSRTTGAAAADEIPTTAQYAATWLRLKYLSEVLQSNLNEVKYLWCDSELSLYFSADEVVDLIEASFDANPRMRETIRAIRETPSPVHG
ncbi:is centromere binding protein at prophase [Colletotrichum lupini]|uniref:Is centromere binding protein at prophase n=1 Tax=Colletotrichum lupini TaxID=145971 RepID=A0A9Q8SRH6_9PEZI|nr:is centromere binding protein at prophase [Colletotrichum lupini]UQC82227.1 is centromere binding protein at prophase [Colletotrichum lupini]